jgi:hypothetical protein
MCVWDRQCPARYGAASVSGEEARRIILEGLKKGKKQISEIHLFN